MYLNNSFGTSNLTQRVKITQGEIQAKRFRAVEARFFVHKKEPLYWALFILQNLR